jgi:hypothetical protein
MVSAATTPLQLLASALNLPLDGQTLSAPPQRILFGAQNTLRHSPPQDLSSITFSTQKDLINHWIVAIRLTLDRDWTWSGLAQNGAGQIGFQFQDASGDVLGEIGLPGVVTTLATQQSSLANQRGSTDLIFFTTIDSAPASNGFPPGSYCGVVSAAGHADGESDEGPALVERQHHGANHFESRANPATRFGGHRGEPVYSRARLLFDTQRRRAPWLEFDRPPNDPSDAYFIRVENYGPDPLLWSAPSDFTPMTDSPIALDPEPICQSRPIRATTTRDSRR